MVFPDFFNVHFSFKLFIEVFLIWTWKEEKLEKPNILMNKKTVKKLNTINTLLKQDL